MVSTQNAWEMFDLAKKDLESKNNVSKKITVRGKNSKFTDVDEEILYIQINVLRLRFMSVHHEAGGVVSTFTIPPAPQLLAMSNLLFTDEKRNQNCNGTCQAIHLQPGERFESTITPRLSLVATGIVYVCKNNGEAHVCDSNCSLNKLLPKGEGVVCPISNRWKYGLLTQTLAFGADKIQGGLFLENQIMQNEELFGKEINSTVQAGGGAGAGKRYANSGDLSKFANDQQQQQSKQNIRKRRKQSPMVLQEMADKRLWNEVLASCNKLLQPANATKIREESLMNGERSADEQVSMYINECWKRGLRPNIFEMVAIHAKNNISRYFMLVPALGEKQIQSSYVEECAHTVIKCWKMLMETPYGKQNPPKISECAVVILYKLRDGYDVKVLVENRTQLCYAFSVDRMNEEPGYEIKTISFIPRTTLKPIPPNSINKLKNCKNHHLPIVINKRTVRKKKGPQDKTYEKKKMYEYPMSKCHVLNSCYYSLLDGTYNLRQLQDFLLNVNPMLL